MSRRRCRNCPDPPNPEPKPSLPRPPIAAEEGAKLWHQSLYACESIVEMMAGYVEIGVPGDPVRPLQKLSARISHIIRQHEERNVNNDT